MIYRDLVFVGRIEEAPFVLIELEGSEDAVEKNVEHLSRDSIAELLLGHEPEILHIAK